MVSRTTIARPTNSSKQRAISAMKSRIPMLWIYSENDTYFGPDLANRMHEAFTAAGGKAEFRMLPPFGSDGHFLIDAAEAVPIWSPLVSRFLDEHQ